MTTILGFDVSSKAIGWGVISCHDKTATPILVDSGFIKPKKKGTIFERLMSVETDISNILDKHRPDLVGIEDIAKFFPGKSSATTIIMLALFNRTVGLQCVKAGYRVELYNVMSIRHGLKLSKALPSKEEMPDLVSKILGVPFVFTLNKNGKEQVENYDRADSIAVALYARTQLFSIPKVKHKI